MELKDVPVDTLVQSFLKAMLDAKAETTVVYFKPENNVKGAAGIATNRGDAGAKRALAILAKHEAGDFLTAAQALHGMCMQPLMKRPMSCTHSDVEWDRLPQRHKDAHVAVVSGIVNAVVAALEARGETAGKTGPSLVV